MGDVVGRGVGVAGSEEASKDAGELRLRGHVDRQVVEGRVAPLNGPGGSRMKHDEFLSGLVRLALDSQPHGPTLPVSELDHSDQVPPEDQRPFEVGHVQVDCSVKEIVFGGALNRSGSHAPTMAAPGVRLNTCSCATGHQFSS